MSLYRLFGYVFVKPVLTLLLRPQVERRGRIPWRGGCILVSNHESAIDPFVVGLACHRTIRWLAKAELFKPGSLVGLFLRVSGSIPVDRGRGDQRVLGAARRMLERGALVGIFPQGTCLPYRHRPFRRGFARLALETGVPIVPVALVHTERVLPPKRRRIRLTRVRIVIGEPIRVERGAVNREAAQRLTERVEQTIADLRHPHGEPSHAWID